MSDNGEVSCLVVTGTNLVQEVRAAWPKLEFMVHQIMPFFWLIEVHRTAAVWHYIRGYYIASTPFH